MGKPQAGRDRNLAMKHRDKLRKRAEKKKAASGKEASARDKILEEHLKQQEQLRRSPCPLSRNRKHLPVKDRHQTGKCKFCQLPFCRCNHCLKRIDAGAGRKGPIKK